MAKKPKWLADLDAKVLDFDDMRRALLAGDCALQMMEENPALKAKMLADFDRDLTDPDDRAIFGLPPLPPKAK